MRELDLNGLRICEYQGKLFESSVDRFECSTALFMRRFYYSNLLNTLDKNNSAILSLDVNEGLDEIEDQFGKSNYGSNKESREALFWVGYLLRYISYTRNVTTQFILQSFEYDKLFKLYPAYHTQDMEWCISSILELYNLSEDYFEPNYRFKMTYLDKIKNNPVLSCYFNENSKKYNKKN